MKINEQEKKDKLIFIYLYNTQYFNLLCLLLVLLLDTGAYDISYNTGTSNYK